MSQSATLSPSAVGSANAPAALQSVVPLTGRILIAPLFLLSGISKLAAPTATIGMIAASGLPFAPLGFALAVLVEVGGSIALLAGYRTQIGMADGRLLSL
ncbi:MAG TPA: DoxX family protein [Sphingobium sp.]|uniref:DoxX family protein n=1 Tax=Sphingobium sp. TaxID=1912891 RepID=UPI002ED0B1B0